VIFDSQAPISTGRGVYMSALAEELTGDDRDEGIQIFSRRSEANGGREWALEDVAAPARLRLYRATAVEHFVQGPGDECTPVELAVR